MKLDVSESLEKLSLNRKENSEWKEWFERLRQYGVSTNKHLRALENKVSSLEMSLVNTERASCPKNLYTPPPTAKKKTCPT